MSDARSCSHPLVPGLVGGVIGAALIEGTHRAHTAQFERQLDEIRSLERSRLAEQQELHRMHQTEAQRNQTERSFQHAVVWLSHCDNHERLDYLIAQNQQVLVQQLAVFLADEVERDPSTTSALSSYREARHHFDILQQAHRSRERHRATLQRARWTSGSVFATGLLMGLLSGLPALLVLGAVVIPYFLLYTALLALTCRTIASWQPIPARFRQQSRHLTTKPSLRFWLEPRRSTLCEREK